MSTDGPAPSVLEGSHVARKYNVVREERDRDGKAHLKPVGTVFIDDDSDSGTLYLNLFTHKFRLVFEGEVTRHESHNTAEKDR